MGIDVSKCKTTLCLPCKMISELMSPSRVKATGSGELWRNEEFVLQPTGPNVIFVRGLVKFVPPVARLVCPDVLESC